MDEYDQFFGRYPDQIQAISRKLRTMVKSTLPRGANEVLVDKHNHIAYDANKASSSRVVYICPLPTYVRLGFMYGAQLDDPEQLLIGEGQRLRHIKVSSLTAAGNPALKRLVRAAWTHAQTLPRPGAATTRRARR